MPLVDVDGDAGDDEQRKERAQRERHDEVLGIVGVQLRHRQRRLKAANSRSKFTSSDSKILFQIAPHKGLVGIDAAATAKR